MAVFWSQIEFFGFRQAVEDPPPILRVLDPNNENTIHSMRMHENFPCFMKKTAKNGRFLVKN